MYFDFKIDGPFPIYQSQKVKLPQFTWISLEAPIKIESESEYTNLIGWERQKGTIS